jgi:hypothetical protein
MSSEIVFTNAIIKDSVISNTNTSITKDNTAPFSFLEFITNTGVDYSPEQYNKFYLYYLEEWANYKNSISSDRSVEFIDLYVDFLKELTITYSTQQELKFLSTLDFNNPVDLDVAIPFYTEKIRQVILFYKDKRDTAKFVIERNKIKGTALSVEKALFEKIYDYAFSSQDTPTYASLNYSLSSLQTYLKIDIREFVDVYSEYFDLPKGTDPFTTVNREDIDTDLFFEDPFNVFRSNVFLTEIPLTVNTILNYSDACDPTNPLALIRNDCENKTGFTDAERVSLKINYLKKYAGVDMHYIDTTSSPPVTGVLFTANDPTSNLQNLQNIYTPTAESNQIKLLRDIGLFFKPDKTGIFQLNANNYTYSIDRKRLEPNKVYIFPNPSVYGNVTINMKDDYPLVFTYDNRPDIKNVSSSFASGDPDVKNTDQTFSPYYSREQTIQRTEAKDASYSLNFNDLFNKGYITKYQTDIYGNEYALFKDSFGQSFKEIEQIETQPILNLLLNGHAFYDFVEGYDFDYSTASRDGTTVRSGLSTLTVNYPFPPSSPSLSASFLLSGAPYHLYFREFLPYQELNYSGGFSTTTADSKNYVGIFRDAGGFTFINGSRLPDPLSTDNPGYPGSDNNIYYYSLLVDAVETKPNTGVIITETTSQSVLTESLLELNADPVVNYDCGYFTDTVELVNDYNYGSQYKYYDNLLSDSETVISSITGSDVYRAMTYKNELEGRIFVKNATNARSQPISSALDVIFGKYSQAVQSEVYNTPRNIEVFYDNICVETDNYIIIDKIIYEDGEFVLPSTKNNAFSRTGKDISIFSNKFYNEKNNTLTFCTIQQVNSLSARNSKALYPNIYQYDLNTGISEVIFPKSSDIATLSSSFNLSALFTNNFNINIVNVEKPALTYNSLNDVYKITYIGVDNNNYFHVFDTEFDVHENDVRILNNKFYRSDKRYLTTNFTSASTIFTYVNSISGTYTITASAGVLSL